MHVLKSLLDYIPYDVGNQKNCLIIGFGWIIRGILWGKELFNPSYLYDTSAEIIWKVIECMYDHFSDTDDFQCPCSNQLQKPLLGKDKMDHDGRFLFLIYLEQTIFLTPFQHKTNNLQQRIWKHEIHKYGNSLKMKEKKLNQVIYKQMCQNGEIAHYELLLQPQCFLN